MSGPTILRRSQWGFKGPLGPAQVRRPADGWWLHHTVTSVTSDPARDARVVEHVGIQRFGRGSYSWLYHVATRTLLELQGTWIGAHTAGRNSSTFGVALIGNYDVDRLPAYVPADLAHLIRREAAAGHAKPVLLGGHRDVGATACPGRHGYALIPAIRQLIATSEEDDMPLTDADVQRIAAATRVELLTKAASNQDARDNVTFGTAVTRSWRLAQAVNVKLAAAAAGGATAGAIAAELIRQLG